MSAQDRIINSAQKTEIDSLEAKAGKISKAVHALTSALTIRYGNQVKSGTPDQYIVTLKEALEAVKTAAL